MAPLSLNFAVRGTLPPVAGAIYRPADLSAVADVNGAIFALANKSRWLQGDRGLTEYYCVIRMPMLQAFVQAAATTNDAAILRSDGPLKRWEGSLVLSSHFH